VSRVRARFLAGLIGLLVLATGLGHTAGADASTRPQTPPPTPVPPRGSPSPFPTAIATPTNATRVPRIPAQAALLADLETGQVLYAKEARVRRPIASVTKVMTALLVLESLPLHETITIDPRAVFEKDDYGASSTLGVRPGERVTVENLLYALLLGSANDAAVALAIAVDGSPEAFVRRMNARATQLGMAQTHFFSASGLDDRGRSTPVDLLRLIRVANEDETFRTITETRFRTIPAPRGPDRRIQNRNALLWLYPGTFGTKTGQTAGAGSCLVASAERDGRALVAIVLHASGEPFSSAAALLTYGFEGWEEDTVVAAGQPEGTVKIKGGTVQVAAAEDLAALLPVSGGDLRTTVVIDPRAAYPPEVGEPVASIVVRADGAVLGRVPLVVPAVPPAPASSGPWWVRAAGAVGGAVGDAIRALAG
jgi:serine-type D-Ala-D-Ala carboxypeptidase (penicillin-binding protein 5/6)